MTIAGDLRMYAGLAASPSSVIHSPHLADTLTRAAALIARLSAACRGLVDVVMEDEPDCPHCQSSGSGTPADPIRHAPTCMVGRALAAILDAEGGAK